MFWTDFVALPTVILNSPAVSDPARGGGNPSFGTGRDIAGIVLFVIGFFWESISDIQKVRALADHGSHGLSFASIHGWGSADGLSVSIQIVTPSKGQTMYQRSVVLFPTPSILW